jgi:hypothetical protein
MFENRMLRKIFVPNSEDVTEDWWQALVNMVMNLMVPLQVENFLTS